jgi:DNA-binding ferritin-like protein
MNFVGRNGSAVLFSSDSVAVIVDESTNIVLQTGSVEALTASGSWSVEGDAPSTVLVELANAAVTSLDISVLSDNDRLYTIPKAVQAEARRGLDWRKEEKRGGTSVGLNSARTLAKGGQIGIRKVRHIAKYFPRHEVDKRAKGYKPGEEGYPSNGRIAWALWGGDAGQRWASAIVEREDAKSASNYEIYEDVSSVEVSSFTASGSVDSGLEFYIRLFADGSGFDRLYSRDASGELSVWEKGAWYDLGESFSSLHKIDSELDEEKVFGVLHVPVDSEAALVVSALIDTSFNGKAYISQVNEKEASLAVDALSEIDFVELDAVVAAAPEEYTPEERADNASKQVRDATGKFAKSGSRVAVKSTGGNTGVITNIDGATGTATVQMDTGDTIQVPASDTEATEAVKVPGRRFSGAPLDVSGILGEPRDSSDPTLAVLDRRLPPLTSADIQTLLADWPKWVADQRSKFKNTPTPQVDVNTNEDDRKAPNAYNDPYLRKWLDEKTQGKGGKSSFPNRQWYNPVRTDDVQKKKKAGKVTFSSSTDLFSASLIAAAGKALTPETSDVPPVYMAVVAPNDPQAVMDLICLIPASTDSTQPAVYTFSREGKWDIDSGMLRDLKSPTPPPVVVLDDSTLKDVLTQMASGSPENAEEPVTAAIDEVLSFYWSEKTNMLSITAAGGADRNRGNAEKLRRYWTIGEGGAKIRWGTGGDWTRCVRQLSKYLGPRAKGYCALRHKEMTGLWTGDKAHRQMYGRKGGGVLAMSDEMILAESEIIESASLRAQVADIKQRVLTASGGFQAPAESLSHGAKFIIPVVVPEGIETGDGRKFSKESITMRELPLPLMWQIKTNEGHYGSVVVGRIDHMERTDEGIGNAHGVFDMGEYGQEAERLVRGGFLRGISADLDKFEADEEPLEAEDKSDTKKSSGKILISKARVMGVTLVPKPAFQECSIKLVEEPVDMGISEQDALVACASVVASIPIVPPNKWFNDPKLVGPTPLTVTDDGRVFGHIAAWHVDHIGLSMGTKPPRSKTGYAYFHTGVVRTDDGSDVPVGQLTLAGGHASLSADARSAAKHYDDTGSAFADVHAGEDAYGIWVAGSLRPEVSAQQVRAIRASSPSGDWRPIQGALELVAVCQVNVPGFPIARARVASGQMYALVAAGASYLAQLKDNPELVLQAAEDAKARFAALRAEIEAQALTADAGVEPVYMNGIKQLLADLVGFYFRAHGYHWNVVGEDFAQYHELFGEIYADVYGSIDPLAENIRKLGGFPDVSLKDYAEKSSLAGSELTGGSPKALAADLLMANEALIEELKSAFSMMDAANEQGVADFIAGRIDAHQTWSWQLASSLTPDDIIIVENDSKNSIFEAVFAALSDEGLIASAGEDFAYIPEAVREKAAEKGQALPDGSFPIRNIKDLKNAVQAYGRAKASKKAAVRKHIMKRAKALGRPDLIPDTFKDTATIEAAEFSSLKLELSTRVHGAPDWKSRAAELSARVKGLTAAGEAGVDADPKVLPESQEVVAQKVKKLEVVSNKYNAKTQPRDAQGRFRDVLARLKRDLGDASLHSVAERVAEVENFDNTGNYAAAAKGARAVIDVVNRIDTKALNPESLESVKMGASALADAISNLPLPFKNQAQKIRYSDVPPALRDLMDEMIDKVEAKIGKEDAAEATADLKAFKSGSEVFSQGEISSQMNKLLRLLT